MADPQPDAVVRYTERAPYDTEVVEVCLAALGTARTQPAPLKGRLAVARRLDAQQSGTKGPTIRQPRRALA